ncbi:MAG: chorismate synthase [Candidatus Omnitrophica bacterium]|nr:chorismate synthase [Candidatus Omnitrophota bacterium]
MMKYAFGDARDVLERASARETAARVGAGGVCRLLLAEFGIRVISHVVMLGGIAAETKELDFDDISRLTDPATSPLRCADKKAEKKMCALIDSMREKGDTLGGEIEVLAENVPPGLGSYVQWDKRLDGAFARALMSIQAVKAVSIGEGIENAGRKGSEVHDPIGYNGPEKSFFRLSNRSGGLEGGVTNGATLRLRAFMKPIATLSSPLETVDIESKKRSSAATERSDVSAVAACGIVAEAVTAIEIASALTDKFGGDSVAEMKRNYSAYIESLKEI